MICDYKSWIILFAKFILIVIEMNKLQQDICLDKNLCQSAYVQLAAFFIIYLVKNN